MNRIVAWFATNHVAANLLMGFAILAGLASLTRIPVKLYPDVDLPIITVTVEYLGAAPEEVESGVCTRIEEHLEGLDGIKELRAIASEGVCTVQVELFSDADRQRALGEVENRINAIDTFPEETEKPVVELAVMTDLVLEIAVTGPTDERALKELGRRLGPCAVETVRCCCGLFVDVDLRCRRGLRRRGQRDAGADPRRQPVSGVRRRDARRPAQCGGVPLPPRS
ncbi:MAG: efflux RND transporter permease subunit [Gammaproteobacteria bacterium]|nr:efflux RND transporter permease subunit [Gammaproteobacteria bacterium]